MQKEKHFKIFKPFVCNIEKEEMVKLKIHAFEKRKIKILRAF